VGVCREREWNGCHFAKLPNTWELLVSRSRLTGGGYKPVYAAETGNREVVNDTLKRQRKLSGVNTGGDCKGTIEEASKLQRRCQNWGSPILSGQVQGLPVYCLRGIRRKDSTTCIQGI
jgi:hypothetical protein